MNLSINNNYNNINFNARYLRIHNYGEKTIPQRVYDAIYKNQAIENFLNEGKPTTFLQKVSDLFRRNKYLDVYYESINHNPADEFHKTEIIHFLYDISSLRAKIGNRYGYAEGIRRPVGIIPKPGDNKLFIKPAKTSEDNLVEKINEIDDLNKILH